MDRIKLGDLQQMARVYKDEAAALESDETRREWLKHSNLKFFPACEFICPSCKKVIQTNISYLVDPATNRIERAFRGSMEIGFVNINDRFYAHPHVYDYRAICMGYDADGHPNHDLAAVLFVGLNPESAVADVGRWLRDAAGHECDGFGSITRDLAKLEELRNDHKFNLHHQEKVNELFELAEDQSPSAVQLGAWMRVKFNPQMPEFYQKYRELVNYGVEFPSVGRVIGFTSDEVTLYYPGQVRAYARSISDHEIVKLKEGAVRIPRRPSTIFAPGDKVRLKAEYREPLASTHYGWPGSISRTEIYEVLGYARLSSIHIHVPAWYESHGLPVHPDEIEIVKEEEDE